MYKTNLPDNDQTRKALDQMVVRLTILEELTVDTYVVVMAYGLWVFAAPFYAVLWIIFYTSLRIASALMGIDSWSELRKARR